MSRQSICAVVLSTVILLTATRAAAESTDEHVLIVGVSRGHGSDSRLVKGLGEHLQRSGFLLTGESLAAADRACESPDCTLALARREDAQLVLTARLQDNPPSTVFITMALFDAVRRAPFQETALCDPCNQDSLLGKLSDVADKLLRQSREARQSPPPAPLTPLVPAVSLTPPDLGPASRLAITAEGQPGMTMGRGDRFSRKQKILAGVFGGLAAVSLATAIALTVTDGQDTSRPCVMRMPSHGCAIDNVAGYATGYALTGALAIGIGLTLAWPENAKKFAYAEVR